MTFDELLATTQVQSAPSHEDTHFHVAHLSVASLICQTLE